MSSASSPEVRIAALIVAGGTGRRMGAPVRKQYLDLEGIPILLRAIIPFATEPRIHQVVVVLPPDDLESPPEWLANMTLVAGGAERGDSVWNGLTAVAADTDYVLIHDGARPFVTLEMLDRVLGAAPEPVIAAVPVTDTIKEVDEHGTIVGTPTRSRLWQAQTPQAFPLDSLLHAYRRAREDGFAATDDAAVFERYVGPVRVAMGSYSNLKVTRADDLVIARAVALAQSEPESE